MLSNRLLSVLLVLAAGVSGFSQNHVKVGSAAPIFSGTSVNGRHIDLAEMRGTVVVITFWSTRCEICRIELPQLDRLVDQYDPQKVLFLALTMENQEKIEGYLKRNPHRFEIMPNSFGFLMQYADRDRAGTVNMGFPSYFVIDQSGRVQYRSSGYDKTEALGAAIKRLVTSE